MHRRRPFSVLMTAIAAIWLFAGCSLTYTMNTPTLSHIGYTEPVADPAVLLIVDKRTGDDVHYVVGKIGVGAKLGDISGILKFKNIDDPLAFFAANLEKELRQRGINVTCLLGEAQNPDAVLEIQRYQIVNYRATGFSPWEAGHVFSGTLSHDGSRQAIKAYIYNGKTPVWSMDEIQDPCFDIPASILIQDVASKINMRLFNLRASDAEIGRLAAEIDDALNKNPENGPFWNVLELGYTNNPGAAGLLKKYAKGGDAFFNSCAISALGLLGTPNELAFLKQLYDETIYNEKYMTVKAIGDIGGDAALDLINRLKDDDIYESEGGLKTVVDLYME
jgi:hypothetical protein